MTLTEVIDREVAGPDGPLRIAAMYASLPPGIRQGDTGQRGRIYAEVEDRHGRRWQAIVDGERADLMERIDF